MNKKEFRDRPDNEGDLSAFEQQLRSIDPTPPQTAWQDMPQLLNQQQKVSARSDLSFAPVPSPRSTSRWLRIATHAAATLIGVGIGAVWVVMLQPAVATAPPVDVGPTQQVAIEQELPDATPNYSATQQLAGHQEFQGQHRLSAKLGSRNVISWPLTPLARDIDSRPWQRVPHDFRAVAPEEPATRFEPSVLDKPMSAPELMREILNEQARLPVQRGKDVGKAPTLGKRTVFAWPLQS